MSSHDQKTEQEIVKRPRGRPRKIVVPQSPIRQRKWQPSADDFSRLVDSKEWSETHQKTFQWLKRLKYNSDQRERNHRLLRSKLAALERVKQREIIINSEIDNLKFSTDQTEK